MNKKVITFHDAEGNNETVSDVDPDLADAILAALKQSTTVDPPRHARSFEELTATLSRTSQVRRHLDLFWEQAIVKADLTSPNADRKAIGIAAAMAPSRLYRLLERNGRPRVRRNRPVD
jgi:hypothetical protein